MPLQLASHLSSKRDHLKISAACCESGRHSAITSSKVDWKANAKNIVVFGNTSGTGEAILPGLSVDNVDVQYIGGTTGVPDTVKVSIVNYTHESLFDLGGFLRNPDLSLNVDVKPSVTMRYLLTQPTV